MSPLQIFSRWSVSDLIAVVHKLGCPEVVREFMRCKSVNLTFGDSRVAMVTAERHIVDLDAEAQAGVHWRVLAHTKGGQFEYAYSKISLYIPDRQRGVTGKVMSQEIMAANKKVANANLGHYLVTHPELIPTDWEKEDQRILLWGTMYESLDGGRSIKCLEFKRNTWIIGYWYLGHQLDARMPALILED